MNRQEAAKILKEVMQKCNGAILTKHVCLSSVNTLAPDPNRYELQIAIDADDYIKEHIGTILERHNLAMKEANKALIIYRPKSNALNEL